MNILNFNLLESQQRYNSLFINRYRNQHYIVIHSEKFGIDKKIHILKYYNSTI